MESAHKSLTSARGCWQGIIFSVRYMHYARSEGFPCSRGKFPVFLLEESKRPLYSTLRCNILIHKKPPHIDLKDVAVVIPAFNEADVITETIKRARAVSEEWRIVVVDDGSTDGTDEVCRELGVEIISHEYNKGNGSSIKTALQTLNEPYLAVLDSDGQLPPEELPVMIQKLESAEMVVGARTTQSDASGFRSFGNWILKKTASYTSGHRIPDLTCGLRIFKRSCAVEFFHLYPNRFSFPTTSTLAFLTSGYRVLFHPITAARRPKNTKSKIRPFHDGLRFLAIIFRIVLLFQPWRFFVPLSILFLFVGIAHQVFIFFWAEHFTQMRLSGTFIASSLAGLFLFCFGLLAQQIAEIRIQLSRVFREKE